MKRILSLAAVVSILACSVANASSVSVVKSVSNPTAFSVYLDGEAADGNFDTVFVKLLPTPPATFTNQNSGLASGAPRPAGQALSYRNRMLDLDPTDPDNPGGLGWNILGAVSTANELSFTGGPLGAKIDTGNAPGLFLANVNMPTGGGTFQVQVISAGALVQELTGVFGGVPIPEPATAGLAGLALCCVAAFRRRSA